ncbi:TetR/AcrR family transcriptional regulator [Lederbergia wuyishanensis]|uniref:AcrR family transcriptional regulator n=1 Tax=Lederbergia wuyishanensis TaxID=1347903 RepID=A0ABU0D2T0_9BACI|nr:TetR family transcriptional regulator [Lederbergia wuyishanensis]MCJ8007149.1 TetR family transcriptional regulator [Lederbergia wuyishanensis]MDQ0342706.1 AcrR family transcriptional regulator [Lederbergia wuyishanensis]
MAPKTKFNKDQIIDAAFDIAKTEGIDSITIRKVANKLGSSIAPIYVNFKEVDELIEEVIKKTYAISKQLLIEQNTGNPFRDIGIASLRFAKEYSVLFRDLVMKNYNHTHNQDEDMGILVGMMKQDHLLKGIPEEELMNILLKMKIFQTGLCIMVANGLLPEDFDEEKMIHILDSTAMDIVTAAQLRNTENEEKSI